MLPADALKLIREKANCCTCATPLLRSQALNICTIKGRRASWKAPVWFDVGKSTGPMPVGFLCDECIARIENNQPHQILFAVEIRDNRIIYHEVKRLPYAVDPRSN